MRFRQFKITEVATAKLTAKQRAAFDKEFSANNPTVGGGMTDFKKTLQAFYATLKLKNSEDGVLANNARKNENMRLVAQFAQDNDLQSMLNPLTGKSYKFADASDADVPGETEPEEVNMDLPTLERMADVGELTPAIIKKLDNEASAARSGEAGLGGRTVSSLFGIEDPETADKIQNIISKNAAASGSVGTAEPAAAGTDADRDPNIAGVHGPDTAGSAIGGGMTDKERAAAAERIWPEKKTGVTDKGAKAKPEHPGKPHPKPSASTKNPDGSRVTYSSLAAASPDVDNPNKIYPGNKIKLPGGGEYTVKKGDTLSKIAQDVRLGNIGAPVDQGPTLGPEAPLPPETVPGITRGPEAPPAGGAASDEIITYQEPSADTAPAPAPAAPAAPAVDPADIADMDDAGYDPVAPAPAAEKEPTVGGVALPDKAAAPTKKPDNVRLPTTKRVRPSKTETAAPKIGSMMGAGYDGTTRLKYLAGIKE